MVRMRPTARKTAAGLRWGVKIQPRSRAIKLATPNAVRANPTSPRVADKHNLTASQWLMFAMPAYVGACKNSHTKWRRKEKKATGSSGIFVTGLSGA
jgi:hypothetical protein